jgi:hypothetical protein
MSNRLDWKFSHTTLNLGVASNVSMSGLGSGGGMSLLKRLFNREGNAPKPRIRICVECGMPIAEHKDWCSILRGQMEMKLRADAQG